ncbi:class I SAM-dependent methyltransferase [Sphingosinicella rhizophila]|uniref:Class I SAM-dependent methyltransferase n=1 Tax=Sphingosinicella rhizophila TaxID=3050082 RepID=A0ABU3Q7S5_9SPHN|nr:class I SAM-dependent methyltransferase [Sphingosinicella sp. GR2756]MDT9599459.1 class I SAM-dependent methyltransferase [Sphingosinicella sp. GR2756]
MDRIVYDRMAELDSRHWWYRARRDILANLIARKLEPGPDARILEIGCGTGHNLPMLAQFGHADAIEIDDAARAVASKRLGREVMKAALPELPGVQLHAYDLVALLDVLEHVEDDRAALVSIGARLKPGGHVLITVPAHPWMWSAHDTVNHHHRRYTKRSLREVVAAAGLRIDFMSYFNSLLFPLAAAARIAGRVTGKEDSSDALPPAPVNRLFETLFGLERHAIGRFPFPSGVSLVALLSAP